MIIILKKYWYFISVSVLGCILAFTLYQCTFQYDYWNNKSQESSVTRVGFSQTEADSSWRSVEMRSLRDALVSQQMELIYHEPENASPEWQLEDIRQLIRSNVNYLVIVPSDLHVLFPALAEAKAANIPVILIDQAAELSNSDYYMSRISADYCREGRICAELLTEKFGAAPCNIVELSGPEGSPGAKARDLGFQQIIQEHPNMKIIDLEYGNFDRIMAQKSMENALFEAKSRGEQINAVFAHSDESGLGALQAIKVAGIAPRDIPIVSINGIQDVCKALIAGDYYGPVTSNPRWGFIVVSLIQQFERGVSPFPMVLIPCQTITAENALEHMSTAY